MWKAVFLLALVALLAAAGVSSLSASDDARARVIPDEGCWLPDGTGELVFTDISQAVVTNDGNGMLTCRVKGVTPGPDGRTVKWNSENTGQWCGTPAGYTTQWEAVITPSGVGKLTCLVH